MSGWVLRLRTKILDYLELINLGGINLKGIDWVIVGGESGHHARPMKEEWVLNIKKQCLENKTPFFFKQWGTWGSDSIKRNKKKNGRKLMGKIWEEYPDFIYQQDIDFQKPYVQV